MKGARVGPEDDGGESVKDVVSLLPTLYLRAALVLLHKFEERLLASTSLEEAFMVLKCLPPSYEALAQDLNLSSASFSVPTHPRSLDLGPKRRSRLTVTRDDGVSSASQSAVGGGPVQDSADEPSAIVQFVKALEMLDALDDTYALAESMARDKKRIAQYPALAPNCTPEGFIIPTTLSPSGALGLPRSSADPAAVVVKSDKSSVASQQSIEEISDDVVTRMVASITAPAAPEGRPNPHLFSLKLPADSSNPPVCEYVMDDGKPINVPGVGESKQPESDAAKVSMTSPTALMSPTMMSTLDCVCDGKLVPGWMLPRQFRALVSVLKVARSVMCRVYWIL